MKPRAWAVMRRDLGTVVAIGAVVLPCGAAALGCLIGLPLLAYGFRKLAVVLLKAARELNGERPGQPTDAWRVGVLATAGLAVLAGGQLGAASVVSHFLTGADEAVRLTASAAVSLPVAAGIGAALVPLAFAPYFAADGVAGWVAPMSRSFALVARLGSGPAARLGARCGLVVGAGFTVSASAFAASAVWYANPGALLALPFGILPAPIAGAWLADLYVRERREEAQPAPALPRLRALLALLAPVLLALGAALVVAALTPAPMTRVLEEPSFGRGFDPRQQVATSGSDLRLPGTSLSVRVIAGGVRVAADDGGGAGAIYAGFGDTSGASVIVAPAQRAGEPVFILYYTDGARAATTLVDRDGVRLDDGLARRTTGRLGSLGLGAIGLGMLLLLGIAWVVGVELGEARALEAPRLDAPGSEGRALEALPGTLRLGPGARLHLRRRPRLTLRRATGSLRLEGEGWVEALHGDVRLRLGEVTPIHGDDGGAGWDGLRVTVLSRFEGLAPTGLRESSTPWPEDARIVLGSIDDAAASLVARASRLVPVLGVPALGCLGLATALLVARL